MRREYYQYFCVFEAQNYVALFINNSYLLFAKQLLQLEVETSAQASAELWKRLVDFTSGRFYRWTVCEFFIVLKRKSSKTLPKSVLKSG